MRAALILLALAAGLAAQVSCRVCSSNGSHPCSKHRGFLEREQPGHGTSFCSVAAECKQCGGALATDCRTCSSPDVERELARRRQQVADWLTERRAAVDAFTGSERPVLHLRTPHCELAFTIGPLTVDRRKLDPHALMHLYGERIEALRALFVTTLELDDGDLPGTLQVFMFRDQRDHERIGPRVTGLGGGGSTGTKLMGVPCVYSMAHDRRGAPDDEALHRQIVHHVAHLLLANMAPSQWLGNRGHGWVDAGVAHWFEDAVTGACANFCYEEVLLQPGAGFKGGRWRAPVRKLVDRGEVASFAELSRRNTDQLGFEEHATAFAYVDFLLSAHGGAKFRDFVRRLKRGEATRDALQKIYGLNPLTIDGVFEQWVKANYSLRSRR